MDIQVESNQDNSLFYYIQKEFLDVGATAVTFKQGYPNTELTPDDLPLVAITDSSISVSELELGNTQGFDLRTWFIDIYGLQYSQARDFAYFIKRKLQPNILVYDFNEGFPGEDGNSSDWRPSSKLGSLRYKRVEVTTIPVNGRLVSTLYYRRRVSFRADFSNVVPN